MVRTEQAGSMQATLYAYPSVGPCMFEQKTALSLPATLSAPRNCDAAET